MNMYRFQLLLGQNVIKEYTFDKENVAIGRHMLADINIPNRSISRKHARIEIRNGTCTIHDLGATNGLEFEHKRVKLHIFGVGDLVQIGKYGIRFMGIASDVHTGHTHSSISRAELELSATTVAANPVEYSEITLVLSSDEQRRANAANRPTLTLTHKSGANATLTFEKDQLSVGSDKECDIVISGFLVPALYAHLVRKKDGQVFVQCHKSWPRLYINGKRQSHCYLHDNDVITVAGLCITLRLK